jgi:hypothetical protein
MPNWFPEPDLYGSTAKRDSSERVSRGVRQCSDQTSGLENNHDVLVVDEFGIDDFLAFEFENGFFV